MNIDLTGRHFDLTPEIRAYAEDKINKLGRLVQSLDIQVTLTAEKHRQKVSIIALGQGAKYTADIEDDDMHKAIGEAVDVLARQIRKEKTSRLSDRREGAETIRRPGTNGEPAPMQVEKEGL